VWRHRRLGAPRTGRREAFPRHRLRTSDSTGRRSGNGRFRTKSRAPRRIPWRPTICWCSAEDCRVDTRQCIRCCTPRLRRDRPHWRPPTRTPGVLPRLRCRSSRRRPRSIRRRPRPSRRRRQSSRPRRRSHRPHRWSFHQRLRSSHQQRLRRRPTRDRHRCLRRCRHFRRGFPRSRHSSSSMGCYKRRGNPAPNRGQTPPASRGGQVIGPFAIT
jgi:hypothetical protein